MIKFFVRILKFSGKYKGRVLSAALFAFIKGICIMMPLFLGFLLFNEFYEGTSPFYAALSILRAWRRRLPCIFSPLI